MTRVFRESEDGKTPSLELISVDLLNRLSRADASIADEEIDDALALLGEVAGFDRTYLFWLRDDRFLDNTHEWTAPGIAPMIDDLQGLPIEIYGALWAPLQRDEHVFIASVADMPDEQSDERDLLLHQDIHSLLLVPVVDHGKPVGLVGYDVVEAPRDFSEADIRLLRAVANGIGSLKMRLGADIALRESRDLLAATLDALPDLIIQVDRDGLVEMVHPSSDAPETVPPEQMLGKALQDVLPTELAKIAREMMDAVDAKTPVAPRRYPMVLDGRERWFEARIAEWRSARGGWVFIIRDITSEHLAARQEESRIRQLQEIFASAPIGIVRSDIETGAVLDANLAFLRDTGYAREAFQDLKIFDIIVSDKDATARACETALRETGRYGPINQQIHRADGSIAEVNMTGVLAEHAEDRSTIWHFVDDQTAQRTHEAEINARKRDAEAANRAKSAFLANMSHEIRTPMNGILGMAELLYQTGLTDTQTEMIKTIRDSGDALLTIINDILDLARIEAGKISFSPRPFVPSDLIRHADALHGASARLKGLDLSVVIGPGLDKPRIGDSDRLGQVLGNLIGNAIKFTETGTVRVNASAPTPETLQFSIIDTGVGMTDEQVRRVFGEFEQADNSISRRFGGSGLGLAISLRLIELMQGRIKISSKLGVGTTVDVEVRLPLADEIAGPALQAPVVESIPPGLHVLVAEDNKTNTAILAAMLRTLGATAEFAVNGEEAVAAWRPGAFDLLLIDVSMPVMDGMEALRQIVIRAAEAGVSAPPAIAVTANVMPSQISEYLEKGFAGVLGKPYRRSELVSKVNDVLGNRA